MAVTKIKPIKSTLSKALDYIENPDKTDGKMLVSSFGCSYETADIEFEYTLSQALQKEALYADYGKLKKKVREYDIIKQNIDSILQADRQPEREKETERG